MGTFVARFINDLHFAEQMFADRATRDRATQQFRFQVCDADEAFRQAIGVYDSAPETHRDPRCQSVLINDWLATKNGWKVGDRVTIQSGIATVRATGEWTFDVVGRLQNMEKAARGGVMLANFSYFDEERQADRGKTSRYLVQVTNPKATAAVSKAIDDMYASSAVPTRTQSEQEGTQAELASIGDVSFFTTSVVSAVLLALLVVTSNMMIESARERTSCFAVLSTLGFRRSVIVAILLTEGLILALGAALIGLLVSVMVFPVLEDYLGTALLPTSVLVLGVSVAVLLAVISTIVPITSITRLKLVDALAVR